MRPTRQSGGAAPFRGFTVVELMLVVTIVGVLTTVGYASYQNYRERVQVAAAVTTIGTLGALIDHYRGERGSLPTVLADVGAGAEWDPWGRPYQYVSHASPTTRSTWRKDHNIVPINSDYDLWSMGKDGESSAQLTGKTSRDDIVRANNGRFVGLASQYDP